MYSRGKIRAGILQFRVIPGDIKKNCDAVKRALQEFHEHGVVLVILPEMWATGFDYKNLPDCAEKIPGVINTLKQFAQQYGMVIIGSLPEKAGKQKIYNTTYVIDSNGGIAGKYRKIHLFSLHGEDKYFIRGNKRLVCETAIATIGIITCYDIRFPELSRALTIDGAEILAVCAQWPKARIDHFLTLLKARAIENQLFCLGANTCGTDGKIMFGGCSAIVSPSGQYVAIAGNEEERLIAEIDFKETEEVRKLIPCFKDRVPEVY